MYLVDYSLNMRNDSGYINHGLVIFFGIMARQLGFGDSGIVKDSLRVDSQPS